MSKQLIHVRLGSPEWTPTAEDLANLTTSFIMGLKNNGGIVTTRHDVEVTLIDTEVDVKDINVVVTPVQIDQPNGTYPVMPVAVVGYADKDQESFLSEVKDHLDSLPKESAVQFVKDLHNYLICTR